MSENLGEAVPPADAYADIVPPADVYADTDTWFIKFMLYHQLTTLLKSP